MGLIFGVILLMSLFCVGVFVSMQEGMILAFLREPILSITKDCTEMVNKAKNELAYKYSLDKQDVSIQKTWDEGKRNYRIEELRKCYEYDLSLLNEEQSRIDKQFWFLKPFVLCVYCFASFWGSIAFWSLHYFVFKDISYDLIPLWIISVFICVVFNAVFDYVLRKLGIYE